MLFSFLNIKHERNVFCLMEFYRNGLIYLLNLDEAVMANKLSRPKRHRSKGFPTKWCWLLFQFFFFGQVYFKETNGIKCKFSQDFQCLSILVKGDSEKNWTMKCYKKSRPAGGSLWGHWTRHHHRHGGHPGQLPPSPSLKEYPPGWEPWCPRYVPAMTTWWGMSDEMSDDMMTTLVMTR